MKRFSKLFVLFILLTFLSLFSSDMVFPGWFKHYGGANNDTGQSIQQTSDGGYIVAGITNSYTYGGNDFAIYKLNSSGNKVWFKHYGGSNKDEAYSIQQTSDGQYIVAGLTGSYSHGSYDFAIYKLDSLGNKVWFKHYGGSSSDEAYSIQQTSDGGYIVAGRIQSYSHGSDDFAIYKLDSLGNKVWFRHYGGTSDDGGYSVQQTSDGGYIVAGYTNSYTHGSSDFAVYRLDSSGNKIWFKHYGGASDDLGFSVQQTSDGGYIVSGRTYSYSYGSYDVAIYRLNSSGNKTWFKHYGGTSIDDAQSIRQTSDGGYVVGGYTGSYTHGGNDFAIYKLDSSGSKTWFKHYGGASNEFGMSIQQTSDGGYVVAGSSYSYSHGSDDFAIYRLDINGDK